MNDMSHEVKTVRQTLHALLKKNGINETEAAAVVRELAIKQLDALILELQQTRTELAAERAQA